MIFQGIIHGFLPGNQFPYSVFESFYSYRIGHSASLTQHWCLLLWNQAHGDLTINRMDTSCSAVYAKCQMRYFRMEGSFSYWHYLISSLADCTRQYRVLNGDRIQYTNRIEVETLSKWPYHDYQVIYREISAWFDWEAESYVAEIVIREGIGDKVKGDKG